MWFDSHSHLQDKAFEEDREDLLKRAAAVGVTRILLATSDLDDSKRAYEMALLQDKHELPRLYTSLGYHPHDASAWDKDSASEIEKLIAADRVRQAAGNEALIVAIGEIGLDYHYMHSPADIQREVFCLQLEIAHEHDLPLIIHMREATEDTFEILKSARKQGLLQRSWGDSKIGVMHCYSDGVSMLSDFISLGFMIGFDGPITFKNASDARAALAETPNDRLLLETDAPYLTPHPFRGKRNEPSYLPYIGQKAAEIKDLSPEEIAKQTTENALRLFRINEGA